MDENKSLLPIVTNLELLKQAQLAYGIDAEIDIAIEELSELTKALLKHRRATDFATLSCNTSLNNKNTKQDIYEEIADVIIVLTQLILIFGGRDEICKQLDTKMTRLEKQLEVAALQNTSIADLNISTRAYNALTIAGIHNLYDLSKCNLKKVRHIGKKCIDEINDSLKEFNEEHKGDI